MGRRATGANAVMAFAFETGDYGVAEETGYLKVPFVSSNLGEEQGLIASDLLGQGREPLPPSLDVANNDGDVVVPVDLRYAGYWFKLIFGAPTSIGHLPASGSLTFMAQPDPGSTITLNGVVWTFVAADPAGPQSLIGANVNATLGNLRTALNASADAALSVATYAGTNNVLLVTHDTAGAAGNAFTLAAQGASHATLSAASLAGGAHKHTFVSGAIDLPSADIDIGNPDTTPPVWGLNFGVRGNSIRMGLARSGLLNMTVNCIAQGEEVTNAPAAEDDFDELGIVRFSQFLGEIKKDGAVLGSVVSAEWTYTNDLDKVETIRRDGRIEDADPGTVGFNGSIVTRFKDMVLLDQATAQEPCEISFGHELRPDRSLLVTAHEIYLPKAKRPITGPKGIQTSFNFQGSKDVALGKSVTVELINDVATY